MSLWRLFLLLVSYRPLVAQFIPVVERALAGEPVDVWITLSTGRRIRLTVDLNDPIPPH